MFTAEYFRTQLRREVEATGGEPVVEVYLVNGHSHRIRAVVDVPQGYVVLEVYQLKGNPAVQKPTLRDAARRGDAPQGDAPQDTRRVAIAYESIVEVRIDPASSHLRAQPGFSAT
jgi:hypothetical protein